MADAEAMVSVVQGDATSLPLPDESVDLVVTSPPYFALRSYQDGGDHYPGQIGGEESPQAFLESLWAATREMMRVLKPSGSIFVNLGDKYAGSGGHNNSNIGGSGRGPSSYNKNTQVTRMDKGSGTPFNQDPQRDRGQSVPGVRPKSLIGMPWRYAIGCIDQLNLILRAEIVWSKPNGLPESVTDRVRRSHEHWFHLTKEGRYYSNIDLLREPHKVGFNGSSFKSRGTRPDGPKPGLVESAHALGKLPSSVWSIPTEPLTVPASLGIDHFAAFPTEWPRRIILGWCPDEGTVLDPFGGTGTTALVARALGRHAISVDLSHDYCRLAEWRINESGHGKKALSRTWAERQEGLAV